MICNLIAGFFFLGEIYIRGIIEELIRIIIVFFYEKKACLLIYYFLFLMGLK